MAGTLAKSKPWASIWLQPSRTFDRLVSKSPGYRVKTLAILYGILINLPGLFGISTEFHISLPASALLIVVVGGAFGLAAIYVRGWLLLLLARLFKLRSHTPNLRMILAWASLPPSAAYLLTFIVVLLKQLFLLSPLAAPMIALSILSSLADLAAWIWMLFILVSGLAVVFHLPPRRIIALLATYVILIEVPLELARLLASR
jgi:hypothetical protein